MLYALMWELMASAIPSVPASDYQREGESFAGELLAQIDLKNLEPPKGEALKGRGCSNCKPSMQSPKKLIRDLKEELQKSKDQILVFVSFSMPEISLRELSKHAEKFNAKLILRGLHKGSFKKTAEKILEIDKGGLKIDIDPEAFREYQVEQVPTFVMLKDGKETNRLSGNVTLEFANSELRKP